MDVNKLFSVKDKVVLVTGGGRGVGEMIATGFVTNGAKVYIASRSLKACKETADRLNAMGPGKCIPLAADLSKYDDCVRLAKELGEKEQKLDVLVNNSGANWGQELDSYADEAFTKVMNLNVNRVFTLTQKLLPLLRKAASADTPARIINIGSVNGESVPALETYAYSTSKAALHHLSRVLASKLGDEHITVNTLACGPFPSKMMNATLEKFEDSIVSGLALKRVGKPEDVAAACLYLSGRSGAWITGATIPVDGGSLVKAKL